jgi:ribose transport system substrate-binding protein
MNPSKTMIRKISLTITALLGLTVATGLAAPKNLVFGVVAKSNGNPVFQAAKTGAEDEAAKLSKEKGVNIRIDWRTPNEEDPQRQANAVEQLVNAGASGIAVSASDANKLTDAIDRAVDSGVPVVMFDSDAPDSKRFAIFGTEDIDCGHKVMSELAKAMDGKGVVAILAGNQNAPNLQKRVQGVREEAKNYPDIKIVDAFYHKETPQDAAAKIEQVMQAHPEITGWAMIGGWPLFTDNALNWQPGTVKVVAVDALPAELDYVRSGYVQVLLAQQVYEWGSKSVDMLYDKVVEGKNPPSTFVKGELVPVTKSNVDEYAKNWEKWLPKQ